MRRSIMRHARTILLLPVLFPILSGGQALHAVSSSASAPQYPLWVDLGGSWQMTFEDRPEFAQADYDDRAWQSITLPGEVPGIRSGVHRRGWLRHRIELPAGTDCTHLALTLGVITQSRYEVWLNGQRLPSSERLDPFDVRIPRPITHLIPPCTMPLPRVLVVAIHFASIDMHPDWRLPDKGPYLLTDQVNAPVDVGAQALAAQRDHVAPTLVFTIAIFLMLLVLCLVAWSTDRARTDLLWFSLIAAERIAYSALFLAGFYPSTSALPGRLDFIGEFITLPLLGEVAFSALGIRHKRWLRALNWLVPLPMMLLTVGWCSFNSAVVSCIASAILVNGIVAFNWWQQRGSSLSLEDHLLRIILLLPGTQMAIYWIAFTDGIFLGEMNNVGWIDLPIFRFDNSWLVVALAVFAILMRRTFADRRTQQRLAQELEAARQVQNLLVSGGQGAAEDLEISTAYLPDQEVGGDFYYVLDGRVVVLGDVSGKGLKAAMLVSLLIGVLRDTTERRPAAVLDALNRAIAGQVDGFVTCICARFESDGTVTFANAGHLPPYLNGVEINLEANLPLGVTREVQYGETRVSVSRGSVVTLVSDGVVEAMNARRELFGFDRTREISTTSAGKIVEAARAWGQNDDITVVAVRRKC
jgi:Stage II sporulation protein E (SpoIIE)